MESFVGQYDRSLDNKGRVILPARLRGFFESSGYLAPHEDGCIALWTDSEFSAEAARQHEREPEGRAARHDVRDWFSQVSRVQMDGQGRMAISADLREHAALDQEVLFVGVYNRVELWSKRVWNTRRQQPSGSDGS